ncbi:hypothetical protein TcWFU_000513 [Taenia crassiceps]|uniref:Kinesin motor domain-containing protein n=1 Tax=Taenia crassiceps TaxID=6207 RepID=A0ABR4QFG0_9CEST
MADLLVALRILPKQEEHGESSIFKIHSNAIAVLNTRAQPSFMFDVHPRQFTFDFIFNPKESFLESQNEIFKCIGVKAVEECLDGFNCSIFAYGMTGTGKTYTIFGTRNCPGLVPQCCKALFESALHRISNDTFLEISFFEVYNEHVYDLLAKITEDEVEKVSLRVREHPRHGPYVENLSKHVVSHLDDVLRLIDRGAASRATAETLANPKSSRSHSVFTIYINQNVKSSSGVVALRSKLHLIDLAGSEKIQNTPSQCYLSETKSINKSLCALSLVIRRLANLAKEDALSAPSSPASLNHLPVHSVRGQKIYVPYRDSKLTWLLRDSLGGNSKTAIVITVSSSEICLNETLHSLRFGQQIKMIKNHPISNKAVHRSVNHSPLSPFWRDFHGGSIDHLMEEISRLKDEVDGWRKLHPRYGGLQMQLHRHKGLQTSLDENMIHKVNNPEVYRMARKRKLAQRGIHCLSEHITRRRQDKLTLSGSLYKFRSCQSEILDPFGSELFSDSSKITLSRGCQTYHVADDGSTTKIISKNTNNRSFYAHLPLKMHSKSLPNICGEWRDQKPLSFPSKSTLEWIWNQDFLKRINSSNSSTHFISTDSLDILLPLTVDGEAQPFERTLKGDLFIPEFIPLPSIKSPISLNSLELIGRDKKCLKTHHKDTNIKSASYADLRAFHSHFQGARGVVTDPADGNVAWRWEQKAEPDALTTVTSLRTSTSSLGVMPEEVHSPRIQASENVVGTVDRLDEGKYGVSPKWNATNGNSKKRPWKRTTNENCSSTGYTGSHSSNDTLTLSRQDDLVFKNRRSGGINSSEGLARSSSVFVDTDDDGYEHTAISQLLLQVTDLLTNSTNEDLDLKLRFSPSTRQSLETELYHLSVKEQLQRLPTLKELLRVNAPHAPLFINKQELYQLESELFAFLASNKEEREPDPLVTIHRCLASRRVRPPYNRFLQLHLRSLLQHPVVRESEETKQDLRDFLHRLKASPGGVDLTPGDANFLLELITMTNTAVFSAVSTPPAIFNHRDSPLIVAAMKIAYVSVQLQRLAEDGQIKSKLQKSLLEEAKNLATAGENPSCPSARFYTKVIPYRDRSQLSDLVSDLLGASNSSENYRIPKNLSKDLSSLSTSLGEVALICAKFKVAKAHHIVKNRFRLSPNNFQRVCVIGKEHHQLIKDALLLITASGIANHLEVEALYELLSGESDVEVGEEDATYLEHLLTSGIDFHISRSSSWKPLDEKIRPKSTSDNKEKFISPVESSIVRNPFALAKTPEPDGTVDTTISDFFNQKKEDAYENESLIKPTEFDSTMTANSNQEDFKSSCSGLVGVHRTLSTNDAQFYFKLISETLMLRKSLAGMQRSPSQLFAFKLAPFQIIQLCDCVRKLSSVEPHTEDGKLIKKLSIEANRHLKFKITAKTVARLRSFYQRIHYPVLQSSSSKLMRILEEQSNTLVEREVRLNAENTFYLTELCSAILFDTTDSLSVFFLESIKQSCITSSGNVVTLSATENQKLLTLAQEANAKLKVVQKHVIPTDAYAYDATRLLCLYKIRALIQSERSPKSGGLCKRILWKHTLTQFFTYYPEKTLKSLFSNAAFNIFVEESDHLAEGVQSNVLEEVQSLIESLERTTNFTPEAVNNLLSLKTKCQKVLEAIQSKFVVSSANNRQINCDPYVVGQWMSTLASCPNDTLSVFLGTTKVEDVRQFLLTRPEIQELNEAALTENLNFSGSDKNLATFEPAELTRITSITAGIGQTASKSNILFILLLETLIKQCNQSKISINRLVFAELQGLSVEPDVEDVSVEPVEDVRDQMDVIDAVTATDNVQTYLKNLILDEKTYCSPQQYDLAIRLLQDIRANSIPSMTEVDILKDDVDKLGRKIGFFLDSDASLLYVLTSLRGLLTRLSTQNVEPTDHTELIFTLSISRNFMSAESPLYKAVTAQAQKLRVGLVEETAVELHLKMIGQLQTFLEEKLTNDLIATASACISQFANNECIEDLNLLSTLRFLCVAASLLSVDIEVKLLAMLLCRSIGLFSVEVIPLIQTILDEIAKKLQTSKKSKIGRDLRLLSSLLPLALNIEDEYSSVEFDKLLTTVCIANCLAEEMRGFASSTLNNLMSQIFWRVFCNQERLTPRGTFRDLCEKTSDLTSEWLITDSQNSAFFPKLFYTVGKLPLCQIRNGRPPSCINLDPCQMESYFTLLQSLLVITTLMGHTDPRVLLTRDHLVTLYHAAIILIHSTHFHGRHEANVGLIWLLSRIEKFYPTEDGEQVALNSLLMDSLSIREIVQSSLIKAESSIVESLRSHIAPIILPLGSDTGNPFTSPDPELVREGLETSLCGYFSISASDALSALHILGELKHRELSAVDLALTCRIINYLFKDDAGRFKNSSKQNISRMVDLPNDPVQSTTIETALSNFEALSSIGSLRSSQEIEIFLKCIFVLSSCIGPEFPSEQTISETIVSSPSETFSSFSVRPSSGTDIFQSPESSPMLQKVSKETSPDEDHTLRAPIQLNVKEIVKRIDLGPDNSTIMNLLDVYHHFRLIIKARKPIDIASSGISKLIPEINSILLANEQFPTEPQTKIIEEMLRECCGRISKRFQEVFLNERTELSLRLLHGYFSMLFPTAIKTPIAAQELLSLRIAGIQRTLSQNELWFYVKKNLGFEPIPQSFELIVVAIQGAQKALEGFSLSAVEQICLLYSLNQEGSSLFTDLAAAINWMEVWPVQMSTQQRQCLEEKVHSWVESLSKSIDLSNLECLDPHEVFKWMSAELFVKHSPKESLKAICSHPESVKDPKLYWLRESIKPSFQEIDKIVDFLEVHLSAHTLDEFSTLNSMEALQIIGCLRQISENTDLFNSIQEIVAITCQRLYLAVACTSITEAKDEQIELPRKYLRLQEILSILHLQFSRQNYAPIEQALAGRPKIPTLIYKPRPKGVHSMETISGSLRSLQSQHFNRGSCYDLAISGQSTPLKRSSLSKLKELIEIRRAVVAGSRSELGQLGYGSSLMGSSASGERTRIPDKLDLTMLRRRCKEHTKHLIQLASYEQKQAELYCKRSSFAPLRKCKPVFSNIPAQDDVKVGPLFLDL